MAFKVIKSASNVTITILDNIEATVVASSYAVRIFDSTMRKALFDQLTEEFAASNTALSDPTIYTPAQLTELNALRRA